MRDWPLFDPASEVPCGICGTPTTMTGTKRCDRCWELERRIQANPALARKILENLDDTARALL